MKSLPEKYVPKTVSIIGAARSGIGAAKFLTAQGISVFISDSCPEEKLEKILYENDLSHCGHESGAHTDAVMNADVMVISPGVPTTLPVVAKAIEQGMAVWSEVELAYRFTDAKFLAVTGSSGKSTTTSILGAILQKAKKSYAVAGNIGVPLVDVVGTLTKESFVAAEISSFQLETIDLFRPQAAAILNLMKNHLDRYDTEEAYYDAKKAIARNFNFDNHLVLNARDSRLFAWAHSMKSKTNVVFFGANISGHDCAWYEGDSIWTMWHGEKSLLLKVGDMALSGPHNYDNASAAAALALCAKIDRAAIASGICGFSGLKHRLEYVAEVNSVGFYNDSKATTAESVLCAVNAFGNNVHLIAGGRDKGCDFSIVRDAIRSKARGVYLIGETADRIGQEWKDLAPLYRCNSLEEAIRLAYAKATKGDVVVLSPGCSSFDMFENYEKRGESFIATVKTLAKETL